MTSDGTNSYSYDSENRLKPSFPYYYDPLGRLAGAGSPIAVHYENYVNGLIAERAPGSSNITYRHVFGPGTDEPIVWYNGSGTSDRRFLHADERGSIVAATDGSANLLTINRYDEYGKVQSSNSLYMGRFLYTGQRYFSGNGVYYYKARMYDPRTGKFMQTDPIGYGAGMNLYAYVGGDPINSSDPSGLCGTETARKGGADCSGLKEYRKLVEEWAKSQFGTLDGYTLDDIFNAVLANQYGEYGEDVLIERLNNIIQGDIVIYGFDRYNAMSEDISAVKELISQPLLETMRPFLEQSWAEITAALQPSECGCFAGGTLVATPSGLVPIEQIDAGELVLAVNEATGEIAPKPVTRLIRPGPKRLYNLALTTADGEQEVFYATDDHPWKVEGQGWIETIDLKEGNRIDTRSGTDMEVLSLALTDRIEQTYNLTVADWRTFLVGEGGAIVHNRDCPTFGELKRHAQDHAQKLGLRSVSAYYSQAIGHLQTGQAFSFRHDGQQKVAYITRLGPNNFMFTSAAPNGGRIYTHMAVSARYLSNIGISLPRGF